MPNAGWTKKDVLELASYCRDGYVIKCRNEPVSLCFPDTGEGLDLWCKGEDAWKTDEEQKALEAGPSFTFNDDRYDVVQMLDEYPPDAFSVEKITPVKWRK